MKATTRIEKSTVISNIVTGIRECSTQEGGGFVRWDASSQRWYEVGDKVARDKVGQNLRDAMGLQTRKPTKRPTDSITSVLSPEMDFSLDTMSTPRQMNPTSGIKCEQSSSDLNDEDCCQDSDFDPWLPSSSTTGASSTMKADCKSMPKNQDHLELSENCYFTIRLNDCWNHAESVCAWFEADMMQTTSQPQQ